MARKNYYVSSQAHINNIVFNEGSSFGKIFKNNVYNNACNLCHSILYLYEVDMILFNRAGVTLLFV